MLAANCRQSPLAPDKRGLRTARGGHALAYRMVAERENAKYSFVRESRLLIAAKARVWASEGWKVIITDQDDGRSYAPAEFDKLVTA